MIGSCGLNFPVNGADALVKGCSASSLKVVPVKSPKPNKPEKPRQHQNKLLRGKCDLGPKVRCEGRSIFSGGECANYASVILEGRAYCRVHGGDVAIDMVMSTTTDVGESNGKVS